MGDNRSGCMDGFLHRRCCASRAEQGLNSTGSARRTQFRKTSAQRLNRDAGATDARGSRLEPLFVGAAL